MRARGAPMRALVMATVGFVTGIHPPSAFARETTLVVQTQAQPSVQPSVQLPVAAADSVLDARTTAVAARLRCPVCQGLSIQDSPSELSQEMRNLVKDQLRQGKTPEEVTAYFVSKYGEWILLEPTARGFNLLVYALPALLVIGGLALIAAVVRKWTRPGLPKTGSADAAL